LRDSCIALPKGTVEAPVRGIVERNCVMHPCNRIQTFGCTCEAWDAEAPGAPRESALTPSMAETHFCTRLGGKRVHPFGRWRVAGNTAVMLSARESPMPSSKPNTTNNSVPFYSIITFDHMTISSFYKEYMR
jgi:hypothetical protein